MFACCLRVYHTMSYSINKIYLIYYTVSAKFDEVNNRTPKLKELNEAVGNAYSLTDYTTFELKILSFFDFNLMFPTAAHYIHYFIQAAICSEDLKHAESPKALCVRLLITIRMFLEKIVEGITFNNETLSHHKNYN